MEKALLAMAREHDWLREGIALIASRSLLLLISVLEIKQNRRRFSGVIGRIGFWVGRLSIIFVWILMICAGVMYLQRA